MTEEKTVVNPKADKVFVRIPQPISALINAFRRLWRSVTSEGNISSRNAIGFPSTRTESLSSPTRKRSFMDWIAPQPSTHIKIISVRPILLRTDASTVTSLQSWQGSSLPIYDKKPIRITAPTTWDEKLREYGIYPSPDRRSWYGQISVDSLIIPIKIKKIGRAFELYAQNLPDWVTKEGPHHMCFFERADNWHFVHVVETDKYDPIAQIHALMGYMQYKR